MDLSKKMSVWVVPPDAPRIRLDQYLAELIPDQSRSQIQQWIRKGQILVNHSKVKTGYLTRSDDRITLDAPAPSPNTPQPEDIPLDVIYEDDDLAVLIKPAGLVCHSGAGNRSGTLVNALLFRMGPIETGDPGRPGIVHRLDKLTSGLMVVAKNTWAHRKLSGQFKQREVTKEYLALVYGCLAHPVGTIDMPIGRDPQNRKKISTRAHKKRSAVTHYHREKRLEYFSLLKVRLETGRTHQIRVHLAAVGHPIVGDALYGGNRGRCLPEPWQAAVNRLHRPFLHACRLEFQHPRSGERLSFSAPLPIELDAWLQSIENPPGGGNS
jgi:23S rRNA pseudouridine1911/1915/1917 synthase